MNTKLIAKLTEPHIKGNGLIAKGEHPNTWLLKVEYLDAAGNVEATGVKWHELGRADMHNLMTSHYGLSNEQANELLAK